MTPRFHGRYLNQGPEFLAGDRDRAHEAFQRACELGHPRGCSERAQASDPVNDEVLQ